MKRKKLIVLIMIILIFFPSFANISSFFEESNKIKNKVDDNYNIHHSDSEFNILTPENTTYMNPMWGYYPATFGFERVIDRDFDSEWDDNSGTGCSAQVVNAIAGHNKVLELNDTDSIYGCDVSNTFTTPQTSGTIEFWFLGINTLSQINIQINTGTTTAIMLAIGGEFLQYNDGNWNNIHHVLSNTWYHIRIDFECGNGLYQGLSPDTFFVYVNGINYGPYSFYTDVSDVNIFNLFTRTVIANYKYYFDDIGYSWDPNYNIGDNRNEGLLLSFETSIIMEWIGYSLDGQINRTILGDKTIPFPRKGFHSLKLFGNDSLGNIYQSDLRYFRISPINILTPENKTYIKPMQGYYLATYGFESVEDGSLHNEWIDNSGSGCSVQVIDSIEGRKKVLELNDSDSTYGCDVSNTFTTPQTSGTIEFWFLGIDVNYQINIQLNSGATNAIILATGAGHLQYNDGNWNNIQDIFSNTWYHIRIDFECGNGLYQGLSPDTFFIYVNGTKSVAYSFANDVSEVDLINLITRTTIADYTYYFDDFGYLWDPNYNIGDNQNEGLLISFENSIPMDWIGYSLDGQNNKTILGDKTIPYPEEGSHTLKLFGNDSLGNIYQSDLRYFKISPINILTPENKYYEDPMEGYYPATFGFENVMDGNLHNEWIDNSGTGCNVQVINSIEGHNKVLELNDSDSINGCDISNTFTSPQTSGTIEFWILGDDVYNQIDINIDSGAVNAIRIGINMRNILYYENFWKNIRSISNNTWYNIRIDFECGGGLYQGLYDDKFCIYIDGIKYGSFDFNNQVSNVDKFYVNTSSNVANYNYYFDAIGYSWDSNYYIGNNQKKGLLISYESSVIIDWIEYCLDGRIFRTIEGNISISFPNAGNHSIQLFGNDSLDNSYQSDIVYFTIIVIDLLEPKNNTYAYTMRGHYFATFEFEKKPNEYFFNNWIDNSGSACITQTIDSLEGHNKVLELIDSSTSAACDISTTFSTPQTSGTLEYWIFGYNLNYQISLDLDSGTDTGIRLAIGASIFQFHNGSWNNIEEASNAIWYHIRVDFECGDGLYQGLAPNTFFIYINGVKFGAYTFRSNVGNIDKFHIYTRTDISSYRYYFDAISYSWDPDYNTGDNQKEGFLVSFKISEYFEWVGYSIDNLINKTILGCTIIPMPNLGKHSIQIFANDSKGIKYQSEKRFFTIENILTLISPKNITYEEEIEGYYPATFGFESVIDGDFHEKWIDFSGSECSAQVFNSITGHKKVLELNDTSEASQCHVRNIFSTLQTSGTIEFWFLGIDVNHQLNFNINSGPSTAIMIATGAGRLQFNNDSWNDIQNISSNTWYHIRVDFECGDGLYQGLAPYKFYIYVNGVKYGPYSFYIDVSNVEYFDLITRDIIKDYKYYIDAIGYSWDSNYNIGDNQNEGLLISFVNITMLEWYAYSLDGQVNRTILGNKTIPFPNDGYHTIQVFGRDLDGFYYQTDLIGFNVDLYPNLNSPDDINYVEGETGSQISWIPTDFNPHYYLIIQDDTIIENGTWISGEPINVNVEGLSVGIHTYKIILNDTKGRLVNDSVNVIVKANLIPFINSPLDIEYIEGETGNIINWTVIDDNPLNYIVYENGSEILSGIWISGDHIIVNVDGLSLGDYNYTIVVFDNSGESVFDEVIIKILPRSHPSNNIPGFELYILLISMITLISIIIYFIQRERILK